MHITHLSTAHSTYRPDERRARKLLMHRKEINKLHTKVMKDGIAIVPVKMYFNAKNKLKNANSNSTRKKTSRQKRKT